MDEITLLQKVNKLCKEAGVDFLFVTENSCAYEVGVESSDHLRRLLVLHEKMIGYNDVRWSK